MTTSKWVNKETRIELYNECLDHWGEDAQTGMLVEELAELIVAVQKYTNRKPSFENFDHMAEEMADVLLMVEEMITGFEQHYHSDLKTSFAEHVSKWMSFKCDRTEKRLAESIAERYPDIQ